MRASARPMLAALVLTLALSSASAKSIPDLVRDLGSKNNAARAAAYKALLAMKNPAVIAPLGAALPGYGAAARNYTIYILNALPPERTRGLYRSLLRTDDPELRAIAAAALFRQGDPAGMKVASRDIRNVNLEPIVAYKVITRLTYVRHRLITEAVRERLLSKAPPSLVRYLLLHVNYMHDAAAMPAVTRLTTSKELETRIRARALLYRFGRVDVVPGLAADLTDPKGTYLTMIDVLGWIALGPKPPEAIPKALLARLKTEGQALTICRILDTLAAWKYRPALEIARPYVDDPDARVARSAFGLIAKLAGRAHLDSLQRNLESKTPIIRVLAAEVLRRFDDHSGLRVVIAVLAEKAVEARREAARVLGDFRMREAIPALIDALEDADRLVRYTAWNGLLRTLPALFPYRRFDLNALRFVAHDPAPARARAVAALRAWWAALPE